MCLPDWSGQAKEDWRTAIAAMSWPPEKYRWHTSNQNQNCVCVSFYLYYRCHFRIYGRYSVEIQWTQLNLARTLFCILSCGSAAQQGHQGKSWGPQRNMLSTNCWPFYALAQARPWHFVGLQKSSNRQAWQPGGLTKRLSCCEPGRTSGYSDDEAYQRVASPLNGGSVYVNSVCMSQLPQPIPFQQPNALRPLSNTDCSCMFL